MIKLEDISIGYKGSTPLLEPTSLNLPPATLTALTGRNGVGKSTLMRCIAGVDSPLSGRIKLGGLALPASAEELSRLIAVVTTERTRVRNLTCRQLVEFGRAPFTGRFGLLHATDRDAVEQALLTVGLSNIANREARVISDGEYQRLMLARALAQDTPIIMLDEPTGFLDVPNRRNVVALLASLARNHGKCILYSTHEIGLALTHADLILHLSQRHLHLLPPAQMRLHSSFAELLP